MSSFERTERLLGTEAMKLLQNSRVCIFGIGGVGGYVAEALARSGVGAIDIVDRDVVSESNINRQIIALNSTVGKPKTEVMKQRILDINPDCKVNDYCVFYLPENKKDFDFSSYDYVVDAVDTVTAKLTIIEEAKRCNTPVISSMGTGNKLNPKMFQIADISKTKVCPLAKVMRRELKKRNIEHVKVLYSEEEVKKINEGEACEGQDRERPVVASVAFVPSVAGLMIAGEVIKDLVKKESYDGKW